MATVGAERDVSVGVHDPGDLRQPAGDHFGDLVELTYSDDGDEVDVAGDGVDLADAVQVGQLLGDFGDAVGFYGDHDDRGDHGPIVGASGRGSRRPRHHGQAPAVGERVD